MRPKPHAVIGAAAALGAGVAVTHMASLDYLAATAVIGAVASAVPDIDRCFGLPDRRMLHGRHGIYFERACRPLQSPLEHRGALHSLVVACAAGWLLWAATAPGWAVVAFTAGWASAILADAPSTMGVPLFWPFSWKRYRVLPASIPYPSGGPLDWPIALAVAAVVMVLVGPRLLT